MLVRTQILFVLTCAAMASKASGVVFAADDALTFTKPTVDQERQWKEWANALQATDDALSTYAVEVRGTSDTISTETDVKSNAFAFLHAEDRPRQLRRFVRHNWLDNGRLERVDSLSEKDRTLSVWVGGQPVSPRLLANPKVALHYRGLNPLFGAITLLRSGHAISPDEIAWYSNRVPELVAESGERKAARWFWKSQGFAKEENGRVVTDLFAVREVEIDAKQGYLPTRARAFLIWNGRTQYRTEWDIKTTWQRANSNVFLPAEIVASEYPGGEESGSEAIRRQITFDWRFGDAIDRTPFNTQDVGQRSFAW